MSFIDFCKLEPETEVEFGGLAYTREEVVSRIQQLPFADVVIIGGGIHGATFARLAAFNGLKTVLFEAQDYASGTSSRSSKMIHGGLRYMEMFDFQQVLEGIKAREDLYKSARHLVTPQEFFIPVTQGDWWFRLKLQAGLWFYDLLNRTKSRRSRWLSKSDIPATVKQYCSIPLEGGFSYYDGLTDDARLVLDNVVAARQEGALCLNYAEVKSVYHDNSNRVKIGWFDKITKSNNEIEAGIVINCAGPWVSTAGRISPSQVQKRIRYSQGTHLLFNKKWEGPALFLPLEQAGRYYFVWPHFGGTLVGTTEREVLEPVLEPIPTSDEIEEILGNLSRDLPNAQLNKENLHYCFAGLRTLVLRNPDKSVSRLSRKHIWEFQNGILTLVGGKLTTASWTALEGLKLVYKLNTLGGSITSLKGRGYPGSGLLDESGLEFRQAAEKHHLPESNIEHAIRRFGSRVRFLLEKDDYLVPISNHLLRGEVILALMTEQVETIDDLMRRRLGLEYLPGNGFAELSEISAILQETKTDVNVLDQIERYKNRIQTLRQLMN